LSLDRGYLVVVVESTVAISFRPRARVAPSIATIGSRRCPWPRTRVALWPVAITIVTIVIVTIVIVTIVIVTIAIVRPRARVACWLVATITVRNVAIAININVITTIIIIVDWLVTVSNVTLQTLAILGGLFQCTLVVATFRLFFFSTLIDGGRSGIIGVLVPVLLLLVESRIHRIIVALSMMRALLPLARMSLYK
jgi:hypothetical protein